MIGAPNVSSPTPMDFIIESMLIMSPRMAPVFNFGDSAILIRLAVVNNDVAGDVSARIDLDETGRESRIW